MRDLLEAELEIQRPEAIDCIGRDSTNGVSLGAQSGCSERCFGPGRKARTRPPSVEGGFVDVEDPSLPTVDHPLCTEVLDGLIAVVSRDVDVAPAVSAAHSDVGELSAAAVGEDVSAIDGRSLHAVHSDGVRVVEAVTCELFACDRFLATVVEANGQLVDSNRGHGAALAGDEPAVARWSKGDDSVPGDVALAAGRFEFRARDGAGRETSLTGAFVEGGDVAAAPREQNRLIAGNQICFPRVDGGGQRLVTTMPETQCGPRVRELGQQLIDLRARRDNLAEALDTPAAEPSSATVLEELRTRIHEAIDTGTDAERKMLLQALVHEVSVTSRDHIEPFFRVPQTADAPAVRAVSGSVDLMGRLSNPPDRLETLAGQGVAGSSEAIEAASGRPSRSPIASGSSGSERTGQLSNPDRRPIQRRLNEVEIDELVFGYQAGRSLADLAAELDLHHRTVAAHLEGRGVQRRVNRRKMSEDDVSEAARRYRGGDSLAKVALAIDVDAATVRRELHRAGVAIRPRRGWT